MGEHAYLNMLSACLNKRFKNSLKCLPSAHCSTPWVYCFVVERQKKNHLGAVRSIGMKGYVAKIVRWL